jgi:hypothetical protein
LIPGRAEHRPERLAKFPAPQAKLLARLEELQAVAELVPPGWPAPHLPAHPERQALPRLPPEAVAADFVDFVQTQSMR